MIGGRGSVVNPTAPHILLVNPWIHDFAAYDFWAQPLGLLYLAAMLRTAGFNISYVDCLDRFHPKAPPQNPHSRWGRGPYLKTPLPPPDGLEDIPRRYSRYGIRPEWFTADLRALPHPDLVLVTSMMTYWYPGVRETTRRIHAVFPDTPIWLGGIYASLCPGHAKAVSGVDRVLPGPGENCVLQAVSKHTGFSPITNFSPSDPNTWPLPALDHLHRPAYVPLLTAVGCPYNCSYCAVSALNLKFRRRLPESVLAEISHWRHRYGVRDFALYDDAFLVDAPEHAIPILQGIIAAKLGARFHTPNALHLRNVTDDIAQLLFRAGFTTIRLGLETLEFDQRNKLDRKVTQEEFIHAVACLKRAGFSRQQVGAYLLVGLPGQSLVAVEESITVVKKAGITPIPAYFTPIPQTGLWPIAVEASRYDLESDPVFTNNAIFPCWPEGFSWEVLGRLRRLVEA